MPGTNHRKSKLKTTRPGKKACARYFTVVARYEDNNQSYVDHVQACDWKAAAEKVKAVSPLGSCACPMACTHLPDGGPVFLRRQRRVFGIRTVSSSPEYRLTAPEVGSDRCPQRRATAYMKRSDIESVDKAPLRDEGNAYAEKLKSAGLLVRWATLPVPCGVDVRPLRSRS